MGTKASGVVPLDYEHHDFSPSLLNDTGQRLDMALAAGDGSIRGKCYLVTYQSHGLHLYVIPPVAIQKPQVQVAILKYKLPLQILITEELWDIPKLERFVNRGAAQAGVYRD